MDKLPYKKELKDTLDKLRKDLIEAFENSVLCEKRLREKEDELEPLRSEREALKKALFKKECEYTEFLLKHKESDDAISS